MARERIIRMVLINLIVWGLIAGLVPVEKATAQQPEGNLLVNGDFEAGYGESWPFQDGIAEVQVAPGWRAFYVDLAPPGTATPNYCKDDAQCAWGRPEFRGTSVSEFAYRVRSGKLSQKYFSWNRQHEAGLMQQVGGIQVGARLRFQVYMQTWSCMPGEEWNECPTTPNSYNASPMHTKVGIDPSGGMNPWAPSVVWAAEQSAYDAWVPFTVEATAQADKVTVFTYSRADWTDEIPRIANDVYIDDASLIVVAAPPTSTPVPVVAVAAAPIPTAVPRSDGATVHTVQSGETLSVIAQAYGVTAQDIMLLNGIANANLISVGQELVITVQQATPTPLPPTLTPPPPTPTLLPPTATPLPPTPTATATFTPEPPPPTATPRHIAMITPGTGSAFQQNGAGAQPAGQTQGYFIIPASTPVAAVTIPADTDGPAAKNNLAASRKSSDTIYIILFGAILIPLVIAWVVVQIRQRQYQAE